MTVATNAQDGLEVRPAMKPSYGGVRAYDMVYARARKVPKTRLRIEVTKKISVTSAPRVIEATKAFAKQHNVNLSAVSIRSERYDTTLVTKRQETDDEFTKRVAEIEKLNAAIVEYKADKVAVNAWVKIENKRRQKKQDAEQALRLVKFEAEARAALVEEAKDNMRKSAKIMGQLHSQVLSDPQFVAQLKKIAKVKF